jgi:hypothetical protein
MINIALANDDTYDLFVSAVDNNVRPPVEVFNARINEHQSSAFFQVQEDGNGKGKIHWKASRTDGTASNEGDYTPVEGEQVPVST